LTRFSWLDCYKIAVGIMKIDPEYFLNDMSQQAYVLAYNGYDEQRRDQWEQARQIAYISAKPHMKGNPTAQQFMPLKWDKEQAKRTSSKERFEELKNIFGKIIK